MAPAGRVLLILALLVPSTGSARRCTARAPAAAPWVDSGRRAMYALCGMAAIAFVILDVAFLASDFSYNIVASGSSTTTPFFYRAAAVWATQQGSLLLWVLLLSFWSSLALFLTRRRVREIVPYAQAVLFGLCSFFTGAHGPVRQPVRDHLANPPAEGAGLDPLLRHTTMMIHPPMLYSGYTLLLVPFAFAVGALISGRAQRRVDPGHAAVRARRLAVPRDRDPARRALVLHRARLGRLLGLGSGRERRADAVAAARPRSSTRS